MKTKKSKNPKKKSKDHHLLLKSNPLHDILDDGAVFDHLLCERLRDLALGPEVLCDQRHVLFGLTVERRVLDQAVHEHPQVVFYLKSEIGEIRLKLTN